MAIRRLSAAAGSSRRAPVPVDRSTLPLALGACIATFALGFVLVGGAMSSADAASPTPRMVEQLRYRPLAPSPPVREHHHHDDDTVMAASARPPVHHRH